MTSKPIAAEEIVNRLRSIASSVSRWEAPEAVLAAEFNQQAADIIERLLRGEFTPDELQGLCHNLGDDDYNAFAHGCDEYQKKLFGTCRTDAMIKLLTDTQAEVVRLERELEGRDERVRELREFFAAAHEAMEMPFGDEWEERAWRLRGYPLVDNPLCAGTKVPSREFVDPYESERDDA